MMDLYTTTFCVLILCCSVVGYKHLKHDYKLKPYAIPFAEAIDTGSVAWRFKQVFIPVYCLVMGSDWLQGPYIYTLYRDEKGLTESIVAALFTTGFVTAAISAPIVGSLADNYGRRLACLFFCGIYAIACLTVLSDNLLVLFSGRILGGIGTTLLYSVFESWMVTEYYRQSLDRSTLTLSSIFGLMTTLNGVIAILSGILGESIVAYTGTSASPFLASVVCLVIAGLAMHTFWAENFGQRARPSLTSEAYGFSVILADRQILLLGLLSTAFEGTMYLFVFFWSAAMKSAHELAIERGSIISVSVPALPFGVIFATFMASMMLGSLAFSVASSFANEQQFSSAKSLFSSTRMLVLAMGSASSVLLLSVFITNVKVTFWCFCLFEACIGIYLPNMAYQKGRIVDDRVRAKVYSILRIPMNCFVVAVLSLTQEGENILPTIRDIFRNRVFAFCAGLLLVASITGAVSLRREEDGRKPHTTGR